MMPIEARFNFFKGIQMFNLVIESKFGKSKNIIWSSSSIIMGNDIEGYTFNYNKAIYPDWWGALYYVIFHVIKILSPGTFLVYAVERRVFLLFIKYFIIIIFI